MVNAEDSQSQAQSEPWSSDVGSNPGFALKLVGKDGPIDGRKNNKKIKKDSQMVQFLQKKHIAWH